MYRAGADYPELIQGYVHATDQNHFGQLRIPDNQPLPVAHLTDTAV